jgi:hypothetical protein
MPGDEYDKAEYHEGDDFPAGLSTQQTYVHIGMFLAWIIANDLYDRARFQDDRSAISLVKSRQMTGAAFCERVCDGALASDMLTEEGNAFARYYYRSGNTMPYIVDYAKVLGSGLPSLYHVQDTWENYDRIRPVLDARYRDWVRAGRPAARQSSPTWQWLRRLLGFEM